MVAGTSRARSSSRLSRWDLGESIPPQPSQSRGGITFPTRSVRSTLRTAIMAGPRRSLMAKRTYSLDFKVSAAQLVTEQGRGLKDAATSLGVAPSTMQYWVRRFGTPAARSQAPDDRDALRQENDRLREENRRLLMERDILKKATAFFAGEKA